MTKLQTAEYAVDKAEKDYVKAVKALNRARLQAGWKVCQYQGCDACIYNNGLVSLEQYIAFGGHL